MVSNSINEIERLVETVRGKRQFIPNGFSDENGVWHDGPHLIEFDAALTRLARICEEQREALDAARAYLEHVEDQDFRRGHTNTSCPPLTRAMCKQYMALRAALALTDNESY